MLWGCLDTWTSNFKSLKLDTSIYSLPRRTNQKRMSPSIKLTNFNQWLLIIIFAPIISISLASFVFDPAQPVLAQESGQQQGQGAAGGSTPEDLIIRRVEIWGVFYRLMVVAFVVGAVVQGSIIYVCWRFRETHKKNKPRETLEGLHR
jgi:hypothetical protein